MTEKGARELTLLRGARQVCSWTLGAASERAARAAQRSERTLPPRADRPSAWLRAAQLRGAGGRRALCSAGAWSVCKKPPTAMRITSKFYLVTDPSSTCIFLFRSETPN